MSTEILSRVVELQRQRKEQAEAEFQLLAKSIATGNSPDPSEVEQMLSAAGKTVIDLEAAVVSAESRRRQQNLLQEAERLDAEKVEITKKIEAADRELEKAENAHAKAVDPLMARLKHVQRVTAEAGASRHVLMQSCTDPALWAEHRRISNQIKKLGLESKALSDQRSSFQSNVTTVKANPGKYRNGELDRLAKRIAEVESQRDEIGIRSAALSNLESEVIDRMVRA